MLDYTLVGQPILHGVEQRRAKGEGLHGGSGGGEGGVSAHRLRIRMHTSIIDELGHTTWSVTVPVFSLNTSV